MGSFVLFGKIVEYEEGIFAIPVEEELARRIIMDLPGMP